MTFSNFSAPEMLRKGFEYDLWATMKWFNAVQLMKQSAEASAVLQHILTTQRIWLGRCGVPIENLSRVATKTGFEAVSQEWQKLVVSRSLSDVIDYEDSRSRPHRRELGEIAWHLINHGTYHRGQMRGIAQGQAFDEFTDTDLILFFDEMRKN